MDPFHFFSPRPRIAAGNYEYRCSFKDIYTTCPVCASETLHFLNVDDTLDKEADRIAKLIFRGKLTENFDPQLTSLVAEKLAAAIIAGYGKSFDDVDFDSPDYNMLENLTKDCYQFSAAKNYQQLKDMTNALKDELGNLRSWTNFRNIVQEISYQYNTNWLQTEYNLAVNSSTLASRWTEFVQNEKTMPLLQYVTAGDSRVREEHRVLDHVKKNIGDPFWDSYYPPNGYNCRCTVNQLTGGTETPVNKIQYPEVAPIFRTNLAKQGLAFPANHPYYEGVPQDIINKGIDLTPQQ